MFCKAFSFHMTTPARFLWSSLGKVGFDVVEVPAAQQAAKDSDQQFIRHQQPSSPSSKSLESPFSSILILSLNFGKSSACLDVLGRCHVIGERAPCGNKQLKFVPNTFAS